MGREEQRRVALLAVVGVVAAGWVIALKNTAVSTPVARAASPRTEAVSASTHRAEGAPKFVACPFPAPLRGAFESAALDAHISPAMLYAVAKVASNLREDARSEASAPVPMTVEGALVNTTGYSGWGVALAVAS